MRETGDLSPRRGRGRRSERGSTTLELVVLFPVVLLIIFGTIQTALYFHARSVALAAAQEGLREARAENGNAADGSSAANDFLKDAGGSDVITGVKVTSKRTTEEVTVVVTGRPLTVIPGMLNFEVRQSASGPVERLTSPTGR